MQALFSIISLFSLVFVNGFTDAPNSLASAVGTGAVSFRRGRLLCAVADGAGVLVFCTLCPAVAKSTSTLMSFGENATLALAAGMLSAIIFALLMWYFGIPTSESHAMSAAISGAAFFSGGRIGVSAWGMLFFGLLLSSFSSALLSSLIARIIGVKYRISDKTTRYTQITLAVASSFMHGAQDGQKFLGLLMLMLGDGARNIKGILSVAAVLSVGTALCTERIVKRVAFETAPTDREGGLAADISSIAVLLLLTVAGIPVSTSNVKVCAMMGVSKDKSGISSFLSMAAVWLITFPACFLLGGAIYRLIVRVL